MGEGWGKGQTANGQQCLLGKGGLFENQIMVLVAQYGDYTKNTGIVHFKWMNCIVCELCLNKAIFQKFDKEEK